MSNLKLVEGELACLDGEQQHVVRVSQVGETDSLVAFLDGRRSPLRVANERIKARPGYAESFDRAGS